MIRDDEITTPTPTRLATPPKPRRRPSMIREAMADISLHAARAALTDDASVHTDELRICRVLLGAVEAELDLEQRFGREEQ